MPPVRCWTFLMFESTTTDPLAMTAPANSVIQAHPPTPHASSATTTTPAAKWRRIDRREALESFFIAMSSEIGDYLQGPRCRRRLAGCHLSRDLSRDLILVAKSLHASLVHDQ